MATKATNIAVIVCSNRQPRVCPQIVDFVVDTIKTSKTYLDSPNKPNISIIDLEKWNLPFYDEPGIPARIYDHKDYTHEHTRAWSQEIQKYDSFIFVTPQYNWGYPAVLKNAIDFLYNEWKGKCAMIVTYGGHGGDKCNGQLRQVLTGLKMLVAQKSVTLEYAGKDMMVQACKGEPLGLDAKASSGTWISEQKNIRDAYEELISLPNTITNMWSL